MATTKPPLPSSSLVIPDLDVTASGHLAAQPKGDRTRGSIGSPAFGTTDLLDEDLCGTGSPLTLELAEERKSKASAPDNAVPPWPSGVTPAPGSLPVDSAQIDRLCPWGATPKAIWQTVPYAMAVALGRRELAKKTRFAAEQLTEAEQRRDIRLAALGEAVLDSTSSEPWFRAAADAAKEAIAQFTALKSQRDQVAQNNDAELTALRDALSNERHQLQSIESQLRRCQGESEQDELNLKRQHARIQRLTIERRNLGQCQLPEPELTARLEALRQQETALAPIIAAAQRGRAVSREALQRVLASAESSRAHVRQLERLEQDHISSRSQELQAASALTQGAEVRKRCVLADLGRAVLAGNKHPALDAVTIEALRSHDDEVAQVSLQHQVLLRALDNFDRLSVKQGLALIVLAIAALVSGLLLVIQQ